MPRPISFSILYRPRCVGAVDTGDYSMGVTADPLRPRARNGLLRLRLRHLRRKSARLAPSLAERRGLGLGDDVARSRSHLFGPAGHLLGHLTAQLGALLD